MQDECVFARRTLLRARLQGEDHRLSELPVIMVIIAAVLIAGGRISRRLPVAIAGYVLLALAALAVLLLR